jgi:DNA-binding NarL/FixJ family response regulator
MLVDDHLVLRQGLRSLLEHHGLPVVAEAANGHEALQLARTIHFDMVVMDLSMPQMNGIDTTRELLTILPHMRVVILTVHAEESQVAGALRAGARGYILKTRAAEELISAITEVAAGGTYLSPHVSGVLLGAYLAGKTEAQDPLTRRERAVLQLVAEGKTTKEVAHLLAVTVKTAECYRSRLKAKLGIHDMAGLVRYALRHGLIQLTAVWFCDVLSL